MNMLLVAFILALSNPPGALATPEVLGSPKFTRGQGWRSEGVVPSL